MNLQSIILLIVVLGLAVWALHYRIKNNRNTGGCCGCDGCCHQGECGFVSKKK